MQRRLSEKYLSTSEVYPKMYKTIQFLDVAIDDIENGQVYSEEEVFTELNAI